MNYNITPIKKPQLWPDILIYPFLATQIEESKPCRVCGTLHHPLLVLSSMPFEMLKQLPLDKAPHAFKKADHSLRIVSNCLK
jgi:hypothetical protein